jgi:hypothetical protein
MDNPAVPSRGIKAAALIAGLLVVVFIGIEEAGVLLGYVLFRQYLGIFGYSSER